MATFTQFPAESIEVISNAKSVAVLTGAGISAESGVPTFRGEEGLWKNHRAEELATPEAFARNPELVWQWYDWRRGLVAKTRPNPGHTALADLEKLYDDFTLITQNVDGHHRLAGSLDPVEMHGNIWYTRCLTDGDIRENRDTPLPEIPPECGKCGGLLRPHIVWFGESLDESVLSRVFNTSSRADLFFVIGTSGVVQPAASLAGMAKNNGATVIEINLEPTPLTSLADYTILGKAGEVLPPLIEQIPEK